jgi:hypothetical protein
MNQFFGSIIRKGFSVKNHEVSVALDGTTAFRFTSNHNFDAVTQ